MEKEKEIEAPKKIVWVSCRAPESCGGKEALLLSSEKTGDQKAITLTRYRCLSCGKVFSVSY